MGDSKDIVDWDKNSQQLHIVELYHWLRRVEDLIKKFQHISFYHIYREFNIVADVLYNWIWEWEYIMGSIPHEHFDGFLL